MEGNKPDPRELLTGYALGASEEEERRQAEELLRSSSPEVERELAGIHRDLELLAETVEPVEPSAAVRARILDAVGAAEGPAPVPFRSFWAQALRIAATVVLLVWAGVSVWQIAGLRRELALLSEERRGTEERLGELESRLARAQAMLARYERENLILAAPDRRAVILHGMEEAPQATGYSFINPKMGEAVLYAYNLPPLEPCMIYHVWIIQGSRPISAGVFEIDASGAGNLVVGETLPLEGAEAWAVTIEHSDGTDEPNMEKMVLKGYQT